MTVFDQIGDSILLGFILQRSENWTPTSQGGASTAAAQHELVVKELTELEIIDILSEKISFLLSDSCNTAKSLNTKLAAEFESRSSHGKPVHKIGCSMHHGAAGL